MVFSIASINRALRARDEVDTRAVQKYHDALAKSADSLRRRCAAAREDTHHQAKALCGRHAAAVAELAELRQRMGYLGML